MVINSQINYFSCNAPRSFTSADLRHCLSTPKNLRPDLVSRDAKKYLFMHISITQNCVIKRA